LAGNESVRIEGFPFRIGLLYCIRIGHAKESNGTASNPEFPERIKVFAFISIGTEGPLPQLAQQDSPMEFQPTSIPDVILITPRMFGDQRGFFQETYHREKFRLGGIDVTFVQDNHSRSTRGVLRGLHYQIRQPQGKLVRVLRGEIWDVAVDLRRHSPTFGKWVGVTLDDRKFQQVFVPAGFAHGFCVVSETADVAYKCTDLYLPEAERSLLWNDPALGITWPTETPILSAKDSTGKLLADAEQFESL